MKINELVSDCLKVYEGRDVSITALTCSDDVVAFDLSDGTHWLGDEQNVYPLKESVVFQDIVWVEDYGWMIQNDDGSHSKIAYFEDETLLDELLELYRHVEVSLVKINDRSEKSYNPTIGSVASHMEELLGSLQVPCSYLGEEITE